MSEYTQGESDLSIFDEEDTTSSDGVTEPTEDTESEPTSNESSGVFNRTHQIKVWADRLASGEKTLDDLPKNLGWLKKEVTAELNNRQKASDIDAIVEAKLAKRAAEQKAIEDAARFESLKAKANALEIDPENKLVIEGTVKKLTSKGMTPADALEQALETYEIIAKGGEHAVKELKKRMQIPTGGNKASKDKPRVDSEEFSKFGTSADRVAEYERAIRSGDMG